MTNPYISQYRENQITSASPEETVLMLYDGAVRFLSSAIRELKENNNAPEKSLLIEKTVKIIDYLHSCLDEEKGDIIAKNLKDLYDYMVIGLTKANLKNDTDKMEEILGLLTTIRDGWNGMFEENKGKKNTPAAYSGTPDNDTVEGARQEGKVVIKA